MKENEYPNIDEERGLDMVAEPAVAVGYRPTEVVDTIDYELRGHDFGMPHTIIELKAELEEADRRIMGRFPEHIWNDKTVDWRLKPTIETTMKTLYVYI